MSIRSEGLWYILTVWFQIRVDIDGYEYVLIPAIIAVAPDAFLFMYRPWKRIRTTKTKSIPGVVRSQSFKFHGYIPSKNPHICWALHLSDYITSLVAPDVWNTINFRAMLNDKIILRHTCIALESNCDGNAFKSLLVFICATFFLSMLLLEWHGITYPRMTLQHRLLGNATGRFPEWSQRDV